MTALLSLDMASRDKTIKNILESKQMGIDILPPDINESHLDFTIVPFQGDKGSRPGIRFGLAAVKNVGIKAVEAIIQERKNNGPFKDLEDFTKRMLGHKITRRTIECLLEAGAFDFSNQNRAMLMGQLESLLQNKASLKAFERPTLFALPKVSNSMSQVKWTEWSKEELLRREKEAVGFYITGHPLDEYQELIGFISTTTVQELLSLEEDQKRENEYIMCVITSVKVKKTKKNEKMAVIQVEDMTGAIETLVFPDLYKNISEKLSTDSPFVVNITVEATEEGPRSTLNEIFSIEEYMELKTNGLLLKIRQEAINNMFLDSLERLVKLYKGQKRLVFEVQNGTGKTYLQAADEFGVNITMTSLKDFKGLEGIAGVEILI
jgi:DNA polymerase-3 subunit alpha